MTREDTNMSWYAARLLYRCIHSGKPHTPPLEEGAPDLKGEESVVLLRCADEDAARSEAERMGRARAHSYDNVYGENVSWEFVRVLDICDPGITNFEHGTEVYSRFLLQEELQDATS
jgi:hypothetical protein